MSKKRFFKSLLAAALLLATIHLTLSLRNTATGVRPDEQVPKQAALLPGLPDRFSLGTDEESLIAFAPVDSLIDSLLIHTYSLRPAWIKTERVQTERALYERKVVRIPRNFAVTLLNIDLTNLLEQHGWSVMAVREKMSKLPGALDVFLDVGRDQTVYAQLHLLVNRNLPARGKEVALVVSGFGLSYDDLTKGFLELPELITLIVPKGQQYSKIIAHEARRAGKSVATRVPKSTNVLFLDDRPDDALMRAQLYDLLTKASDGAVVVAYEKIHTLNLLKSELPILSKKGYRLVSYIER